MKQYNKEDVDRIVFISDIHLGVKNASIEWVDNVTKYFDNFFIPLLKKYINNNENVIVVIAGDFFDNRQHIDINILNIGVNIMKKISSLVEVFVIIGNHDIYKKKDTDVTSLRLFEFFDNVHLISELSELILKGKDDDHKRKMMLVPWVGNHAEETKILSKHTSEDFVIMHTDIAGLKFDNGREIIDGTNINVLKKGKIYSGHIHKRQESEKVVYLGSPYQMRRSDIGNDKGIYSLKITNESVEEVFELNKYSPKFLKLRLLDILELPLQKIKKLTENNYVDIIIKKSIMNEINMAKLMEAMEICNTKKIEVILDKNDTEDVDNNPAAKKDMSITEIVAERLASLRDLTEEDRKTLASMNINYLTLAAETLGSEIEIG